MSKSHRPPQEQSSPSSAQAKPVHASEEVEDLVEEASDESFPASDPPAFTHTSATRDGDDRAHEK